MASVFVLADQLLTAETFTRTHFQPLETLTQNFLCRNDRLIANSYKAWGDYRLWQNYSVLWLLGAYTELVRLNAIRVAAVNRTDYIDQLLTLELTGGGFSEFFAIADRVDRIMEWVDMTDEASIILADEEIRHLFSQIDSLLACTFALGVNSWIAYNFCGRSA